MEYGKIIRRALQIIWQHKILWVFGMVAVFFGARHGGGGGGGIRYALNSMDMSRWRRGVPWTPFDNWRGPPFLDVREVLPLIIGVLAIVAFAALVFLVLSVIARYTSTGALIGMVNEVEQSDRTTFRSGLKQGWQRFLRLFAISLIVRIVATVIMLVIVLAFALLVGMLIVVPISLLANAGREMMVPAIVWTIGVGLILVLLIILAATVLAALGTLVLEFAGRACVIDGNGVVASLGQGIALVRGHLREAGLMWFLLLAINLAFGLITIPLALLGVGGLIAPALVAFRMTESAPAAMLAAMPFLLLLLLVSAVVSGIYLAFRSTVWTLVYRELTRAPLTNQAPAE